MNDPKTQQLAEWIYQGVLKVAPKTKKPNFDTWVKTLDLMLRIDKHTHREIATVFKWANNDEFWKLNILSPAKLREKYAVLHAKAEEKVKANQPPKDTTSPQVLIDKVQYGNGLDVLQKLDKVVASSNKVKLDPKRTCMEPSEILAFIHVMKDLCKNSKTVCTSNNSTEYFYKLRKYSLDEIVTYFDTLKGTLDRFKHIPGYVQMLNKLGHDRG